MCACLLCGVTVPVEKCRRGTRSSYDAVRLRVLEDVSMSSQNVQLYDGLKPCEPSGLRITKAEYMKVHSRQGI